MALNPADMESCTPKARCISGPNEGVAYDRDDPCGGGALGEFDPFKCDCTVKFPTGAVQMRIASGNLRGTHPDMYDTVANGTLPTDWVPFMVGPYYDTEGKLIQGVASLSASWLCDQVPIDWSACRPTGDGSFTGAAWPTSVSATKTGGCSGGSANLFWRITQTYTDGVLTQDWTLTLDTYVGTSYTSLNPPTAGLFCDYPTGTTWSGTIEYRTSDGNGGWLPGIQ